MRDGTWSRSAHLEEISSRIWAHLSPNAVFEPELIPAAAALLEMDDAEVARMADLHFALSDEVGALLDDLPTLSRKLATTTITETESAPDRVRGAILWGETLSARNASGLSTMFVTAPARRAFSTPENQLLVTTLHGIVQSAESTGWSAQPKAVGGILHERVLAADRWRQRRALSDIRPRALTPREVARVKSGRHARRYSCAIAAYELYEAAVLHRRPEVIRDAIERHGLATRDDPKLFEIAVFFRILDALATDGFKMSRLRLFGAGLILSAHGRHPDGGRIQIWYQHAPSELAKGNRYRATLVAHEFPRRSLRPLRPDFTIRNTAPNAEARWVVGEVKLTETRSVADAARGALFDLLAYGEAYAPVLGEQSEPYGLGVAWGKELDADVGSRVALCTPDRIAGAVLQVFNGAETG